MWIQKKYDPRKHTKFIPKNKEKYKGKYWPVCRSQWEYAFANICDRDPRIIEWTSESISISYMFRGQKKTYYPDFFIKIINKQNKIDKYLIEIKPAKECGPPTKKGRKRATYLKEHETWEKNKAKWEAAKRVCKKMGWNWKILTEKELFGGK